MKKRWLWALALQIAQMAAVGLLTALAEGAGALPRALMLWVAAPVAGLVTACRAVQRGLNNYLAWIAPVPCLYGINLLVWGYAPPPGPALLTAFLSLVGAAAGQVIVQRGDNDTHSRRRRR
jgi:hypothetical protein